MGDEGRKQTRKTPEKSPVSKGAAHNPAHPAEPDADLAELLNAWPNLSPARRRVILGIVRGR